MSTKARVFMDGSNQVILLPEEYRVKPAEVRISRVPEGILITEGDPWESFRARCELLSDEFFEVMEQRVR